MSHQENKKGEKTMKKIAITTIAVLFLLVGFKYASAQTYSYTMGGKLTTFTLDVVYEQEVLATSTLSQGKKLITVVPGLEEKVSGKFKHDPILYWDFDTNNRVIKMVFDWLSPNPVVTALPDVSGGRIYTLSCSGGNQDIPLAPVTPDLPELLDGMIGAVPQTSLSKPPATYTVSFEGYAGCYLCPDGFAFSSPGVPTGQCNNSAGYSAGESYGRGYLIYKGTATVDTATGNPTSFSVTGQMGGSGFYYDGADWASPACPTAGLKPCKSLFNGTFGATLTLCSDSTCSTL